MLQFLKLITIFASSVEKDWRHREEQLSFDLSENLENSSDKGKSLRAASPAVAYILLTPCFWGSRLTYIPAGVSCFFILIITGIPEPSD